MTGAGSSSVAGHCSRQQHDQALRDVLMIQLWFGEFRAGRSGRKVASENGLFVKTETPEALQRTHKQHSEATSQRMHVGGSCVKGPVTRDPLK
jgi:hypothetical protein